MLLNYQVPSPINNFLKYNVFIYKINYKYFFVLIFYGVIYVDRTERAIRFELIILLFDVHYRGEL